MERLNLGCGLAVADGWTNVDIDDHGQEHVLDMRDGLPFADGHFGLVVANHVLHMLTFQELPGVLSEIRRVLAADGVLRIIEADPIKAFRAWERDDGAWFPIADDVAEHVDSKLALYLTWYSTRRSILTPGYLALATNDAGFAYGLSPLGRLWAGDGELDTRHQESFLFEAFAS